MKRFEERRAKENRKKSTVFRILQVSAMSVRLVHGPSVLKKNSGMG